MSIPRLSGLPLVLALAAACSGDSPAEPAPFDAAEPVLGVSGGGAFVDHFADDGLILLTVDPDTGLNSVHYTQSSALEAFLSGAFGVQCPVPEYDGAIRGLIVASPSGNLLRSGHGKAYVLVASGAGFPGSLCDPVAGGVARVQITVHPGGASGVDQASFSSNTRITLNADGSRVHLHMSRKGLSAPLGTVRLR